MSLGVVSLRALLFLELLHTGRRSLVSSAQLQEQPKKIGKRREGRTDTASITKRTHGCDKDLPAEVILKHKYMTYMS